MVLFTKWALNKTYGIVDKGKTDHCKLKSASEFKVLPLCKAQYQEFHRKQKIIYRL